MKTSRILILSVFALVAAGSFVRAEKSVLIEKSFEAEQTRSSASDDWCRNDERNGDRYERTCEVRTVTIAAPSTLDVETSNGSIAVTGGTRRDVVIQTKVVAQAETMTEAKSIAADVKLITDGGNIRAEGPRLTGRGRSWWVTYRIETPERQNVSLGSSNGSVTMTGLNGTIRADTSNGSLHANDLSGDVKVSTSNGSMNVNRPMTMQGRIGRDIDTTLGKGGPTLRFVTSNGSLNIRER